MSSAKEKGAVAAEKAHELTADALARVADFGINGCRFLCSAKDLAKEYENDDRYPNAHDRVDALIAWERAKSFTAGFATGIGGLITLPIQVPAALLASWVIQSRLAAAVAELYGHDSKEDRVRTLVLCCLLGDSAKEALKRAGITISNKLGATLVSSIPGRVFIEINKRVGFRLITKAGERGVINVVKLVPLLGGVVAGTIDSIGTHVVGKASKELFGCLAPGTAPAAS